MGPHIINIMGPPLGFWGPFELALLARGLCFALSIPCNHVRICLAYCRRKKGRTVFLHALELQGRRKMFLIRGAVFCAKRKCAGEARTETDGAVTCSWC